jgi:DNA-directed RNA polymerase subunit alpha
MAAVGETPDLKEVLTKDEVPLEQFHDVRRQVHCHVDLRTQLESLMAEFGGLAKRFSSENKAEVRRGVGRWLLGHSEEAARILEPARASKERSYFLGVSYLEIGRAAGALVALKEALDADASDPLISAATCEAKIRAGLLEEAETHVERLVKKKEPSAEAWYLKALLEDVQGFHEKAMESYEKALEIDPGHAKALFRLAYIMDLTGEDARALELYEQLRKMRPMHLHAVMNLGVLYEDRGDPERAAQCYQAVLDYFPTHSRAKLYLSDAQGSMTMYYDEEAARRDAKLQQVLGQPVAEVSFSPRVRGALQKLGVTSLGDLVRRTEDELLAVPNFGRTSLRELKEFLSSKGLALASDGSVVASMAAAAPAGDEGEAAPESGTPGPEALQKNLGEMEWSGRIRKVFEKMGVVTLSDLLAKSEKDLLKNKNLGVTSIKEIRKKLGTYGLGMREE